MPFTPFHFGPGFAIKGFVPRTFSWSAFVLAQIFIDCESLYYLLHQQYPVHRFFHTFVGAFAMGLAAAAAWLLLIHWTARLTAALPNQALAFGHSSATLRSEFSSSAVWMGGIVGGLSHPLLDGIMHRDVRPLMPFSDRNPFLYFIGVGTLHVACVVAGMIGIGITLWRVNRTQEVK